MDTRQGSVRASIVACFGWLASFERYVLQLWQFSHNCSNVIVLTPAEWRIMNCVWESAPVSVREVHAQLQAQTDWSYSTVKTLMSRLVEKQVLEAELRGNVNYFQPRASRQQARQSAVGHLLESAFNGGVAGLVQHLISERRLKPRELDELRQLLKDADADEGS